MHRGLLLTQPITKTKELIKLILSKRRDLSEEDILKMIEERISELGGLIDDEAAAMLIAKELGVQLPLTGTRLQLSSLKIRDITPGYRNITLKAHVLKVSNIFRLRKNDEVRRYVRVLLGDETGQVWLILWNDLAVKAYNEFIPGDLVLVEKAYCKKYRDRVEIGLLRDGKITLMEKNTSIDKLMELKSKHNLNIILLQVADVVRGPKATCIYGYDGYRNMYRVVLYDVLEEVRPGKMIIVQDYREGGEGTFKIYTGGLTRLYVWEGSSFPEVPSQESYRREVLNVSSLNKLGENMPCWDVDLKGFYVGFIPFRRTGGSLWISDAESVLRIPLFDDNLLESITKLKVLNEIVLKGVSIRKNENRYFLKVLPCSTIIVTGKVYEKMPLSTCNHLLTERSCKAELNATVTSLSIGVKQFRDAVIVGLSVWIDDGTGQAHIIVNNEKIIEELLGISLKEFIEYKNDNILEEVIDFLKDDIIGNDVGIKGILLKSGILIPSQIRLISAS